MSNVMTEFHLADSTLNLNDHDFDTVFEDSDLVTRAEFKETKFTNDLVCELFPHED